MKTNVGNQESVSFLLNPKSVPLVIVSGLPASGKTTLSRRLAPALSLPLFDKDDILEGLFEALGTGDADWRQRLSRASDKILQRLAETSSGTVLTSFWRGPGESSHSGTPTNWIEVHSSRVVEVYCVCDLEIAASRFINRDRHPGHLDGTKRIEDVVSNFRNLAAKGHLGIGKLVQVNTSSEVDFDEVISKVRTLLELG